MDLQGIIEGDAADPTALAKPRLADVGNDPVEPRTDALAIAQSWPGAPGTRQRLLHGVLGLPGIAEQVSGEFVCGVEMPAGLDHELMA